MFVPYTYQNKNVVILINTLYFVVLSEIIVGSISNAYLEISTS